MKLFWQMKKAKLCSAFQLQNQILKIVQVATKNLFYIFKAWGLFGHLPHFHPRKTFIFCNNI